MSDRLRFIAAMPRLRDDGAAWVADVRRLEALGFDTLAVSEHMTRGWQLGLLPAMAFAAASTTRLRVLSLVAQNDLRHPALLAKDIATLDVLSSGRVELGIGSGWLADDYTTLGMTMRDAPTRIARLAEALAVIRRYFTTEIVDHMGEHYRIDSMEALPRCVQRPNPPILVGAGGPKMLDLSGRYADIVGIHPRMSERRIGGSAIADLTASAIEAKIERVRVAAADAGREMPILQFSCYYVRVTDADHERAAAVSTWASEIEGRMDVLAGSPAVLVGTADECAEQLTEWAEQFGIRYWHLGADAEAVAPILSRLRQAPGTS